jgi:hypothetical protein
MLMWRGVRVKEVITPDKIMNDPRKAQGKGQLLKLLRAEWAETGLETCVQN